MKKDEVVEAMLQEEMKNLEKVIKENPFAVVEFLESFFNEECK